MEIGVFGINGYAASLCRHWISQGHSVLFADHLLSAEVLNLSQESGPQISFAAPSKVVQCAEIIVLAIPFQNLRETLEGLAIRQKVVIDLIIEQRDGTSGTSGAEGSFEQIQHLLPEAIVVKVTPEFPHHIFKLKSSATEGLYSYSNDQLAQRMVSWFLKGSGYEVIDLKHDNPLKHIKITRKTTTLLVFAIMILGVLLIRKNSVPEVYKSTITYEISNKLTKTH